MKLPRKKRFISKNGEEAENLSDLKNIIAKMSENDFKHHLAHQNDFAAWVRDILHKDELAEELGKLHSKEEVLSRIGKELEEDKRMGFVQSTNFHRFMAKQFVHGLMLGLVIGVLITILLLK